MFISNIKNLYCQPFSPVTYGNGKIDRYPLKKLLIFTEKLFEKLKKELAQFTTKKTKKPKSDADNIKRLPIVQKKQISQRIIHDYQPSHIWSTRNSSYWQWKRVKEWFIQYAQDNQQEMTPKNILKRLIE